MNAFFISYWAVLFPFLFRFFCMSCINDRFNCNEWKPRENAWKSARLYRILYKNPNHVFRFLQHHCHRSCRASSVFLHSKYQIWARTDISSMWNIEWKKNSQIQFVYLMLVECFSPFSHSQLTLFTEISRESKLIQIPWKRLSENYE